ncbi:MAG: zinc ribbon domain-containing protein, partial [Candidatus Njordarchaeota archaeon]
QWTRFHAHYVDCIIKDARAILLSWYENYISGRRTRRCPWIKSNWVRVKSTQYRVNDNKIQVTIIPRKKYFEFEIPENAWFRDRIRGWKLGEIILRPSDAILTFNRAKEKIKPTSYISIDVNLDSIDMLVVTDKGALWIQIDWREVIRLNELYQSLRSRIQSELNHNRRRMKQLLRKYSGRKRSRVDDLLHKMAKFVALLAKKLDALIIIEDLEKESMYSGSRKHNREIWMRPWRTLVQYFYKAPKVETIDPRFTTKQCSYCGSKRTIVKNGTVYCQRCGRSINRQLNAIINIYTKYLGLRKIKKEKKGRLRILQTKIRKKMPEVPASPIVLTIDQMHSYSQAAKEILKLLK